MVAGCILTLDQGMIMAAIANALADDAIQHAFSDGAIEQTIRPLIAMEEFSTGPPDSLAETQPALKDAHEQGAESSRAVTRIDIGLLYLQGHVRGSPMGEAHHARTHFL